MSQIAIVKNTEALCLINYPKYFSFVWISSKYTWEHLYYACIPPIIIQKSREGNTIFTFHQKDGFLNYF